MENIIQLAPLRRHVALIVVGHSPFGNMRLLDDRLLQSPHTARTLVVGIASRHPRQMGCASD